MGLHTGVFGHVRLLAAPADTGIVFRRTDLDNFPIEAQGHNVARVSYATSLMKQGVLLSTTEHLLAAIYSCGIDNVYIDIDSIEIPILDGSAEPFIQMLEKAGVRKLRRKRRYLKVLKPLEVEEGDRRIGIYPADEFRVRCYVDFPHPLVGQQEIEMVVNPETFRQLLARARTFCFERGYRASAFDGPDSRRFTGQRHRLDERRRDERAAEVSRRIRAAQSIGFDRRFGPDWVAPIGSRRGT